MTPDGFNATVGELFIASVVASWETVGFCTTSEMYEGGQHVTIVAMDAEGASITAFLGS